MEFVTWGSEIDKLDKIVRESSEKNIPIICLNESIAENIKSYSDLIDLKIPPPVTIFDFQSGKSNEDGYLIYQIEQVLFVLLNKNVSMVTSTLDLYPKKFNLSKVK